MSQNIVFIPADHEGNKLILKDLRREGDKTFVFYKTTYNDIPFTETEIFPMGDNYVITGDDGTILYTFVKQWLYLL